MRRWLIVGASRGLGHAFACGLPKPGDQAFLVSRSRPESLGLTDGVKRTWIEADVLEPDTTSRIASSVGEALDVLVYNTGIWEPEAFSRRYNPETVSDDTTREIIAVNLTGAITVCTALLPALRRSNNPKIILIGSVNGLEHTGMREVAYNASKFGLRGVAHALRENLRSDGVGVTCINPGSIDTDALEPEQASRTDLIPAFDLVRLVRCICDLSNATCVKEVDVPAMQDTMV